MLLGRHLFVGVMQFHILPIRACVDKKNSGCLGKIKKCHLIRQIISIYLCFRPRLLSDDEYIHSLIIMHA